MYDPLTAHQIPVNHQAEVVSYWPSVTPPLSMPASSFAPTALPSQVDTLIIGGGYTGLTAARYLLSKGIDAQVVEAGSVGAGCSSRNAGFVLPTTGRLSLAAYHQRFGEQTAQGVAQELMAAVEQVSSEPLSANPDTCLQTASYLRIAHNQHQAQLLQQQLQQPGWQRQWLPAEAFHERFPSIQRSHGAIIQRPAAAVNPLALVHHYAKQIGDLGGAIHCQAPVVEWQQQGAQHYLTTPRGSIRCRQVLVCTNGYTPSKLHPALIGRTLPALSSVIVTAKLNEQQRQQLGLTSDLLMMDTRALKYYYRLLPDGRLLFGGRGAIHGKDAEQLRYQRALQQAMSDTLPLLGDIPIEFFWSGWVSVALDSIPRVYQFADNAYTAMGYCGAGISFASLAGKRLAQLSLGEPLPALPFYQSALPKFPFPAWRRVGQALAYHYYQWADKRH